MIENGGGDECTHCLRQMWTEHANKLERYYRRIKMESVVLEKESGSPGLSHLIFAEIINSISLNVDQADRFADDLLGRVIVVAARRADRLALVCVSVVYLGDESAARCLHFSLLSFVHSDRVHVRCANKTP